MNIKNNMDIKKAKQEYRKEVIKEELDELKDILSDGEHRLLGIDKETWDAEEFDPHTMLFDWLFAKKHGFIKFVREQEDEVDHEKDVVIRPTEKGKKFLNWLIKQDKKVRLKA
ncbi:MAG: hypothetical protein QXN16_00635 [Candidatus Micrarchaeaceae archaeon]